MGTRRIAQPPGFKIDFGKGLVRIADMFQHVVADDHVVGVAGLVDGGDIEMQVRDGRIEVGGGIVEVFQSTETLQERLLRREMQDLQRCSEEIRLLFQVEPQQTMPFERQALGAQTVIHRLAVAIGQKLTEMTAANGAFHLVAEIKRAH